MGPELPLPSSPRLACGAAGGGGSFRTGGQAAQSLSRRTPGTGKRTCSQLGPVRAFVSARQTQPESCPGHPGPWGLGSGPSGGVWPPTPLLPCTGSPSEDAVPSPAVWEGGTLPFPAVCGRLGGRDRRLPLTAGEGQRTSDVPSPQAWGGTGDRLARGSRPPRPPRRVARPSRRGAHDRRSAQDQRWEPSADGGPLTPRRGPRTSREHPRSGAPAGPQGWGWGDLCDRSADTNTMFSWGTNANPQKNSRRNSWVS